MPLHLRTQLILSLLLVGFFVVLVDSPVVYSQFLAGCNVVGLAPTGPPVVGAGQTLQVTTTVTGSCDQSMFYAVRVDLVDGRSTSQVLSSVVFPYAPVTAGFIVSVTNKATAPTTLGTWVLQINAYLIASINGGIVASAHQLFSVVVVQYTPTTTSMTSEQIATNSTTTIFLMPLNSTSQMIASETSSATSSPPTLAQSNNQTSSGLFAPALVLIVLAAIVLVVLLTRKRTAQRSQQRQSANVKYCGKCGSKIDAADEFCSHCGTPQK